MTTAAARRKAVREAGEQIMALIQGSPSILSAIAHDVIAAKVAAGELIWAESLQVGPGLEIQPKGSLRKLEDAIDDALDALDAGNSNRAKTILAATIPPEELQPPTPKAPEATAPAGEPSGEEDGDEPPTEPVEGDEPDEPAEQAAGDEPDADGDDADAEEPAPTRRRRRQHAEDEEEAEGQRRRLGRPEGFPELDGSYTCERVDSDGDVCGVEVDGRQAQISFTRFRGPDGTGGVKLCRDCMANFDPKDAAPDPKDALVKPS